MIRLLLLFSILILYTQVWGQEEDTTAQEETPSLSDTTTFRYWKIFGNGNLNFSQSSFVNWAGGGENSLSLNGIATLFASYHKGNWYWDNRVDMAYGMLKTAEEQAWRKTADRFDIRSRVGRRITERWSYSSFTNFRTQFADGFDQPGGERVSAFMAPAYLVNAIGINYKTGEELTLFISPLTNKLTFVLDDALANKGAYGVEPAVYDENGNIITPGKKVRSEIGASFSGAVNKKILQNIRLQSRVDLFANYFHKPFTIDISWETQISFKVNDYIAANLFTHLIYDADAKTPDYEIINGEEQVIGESAKLQLQEVLGIGLSYDF